MTSWCELENRHDDCPGRFQRFVFEKNKLVWLDEWVECKCKKRGCKCYTAPEKKTRRKSKQ